jgi:hypothetical protein
VYFTPKRLKLYLGALLIFQLSICLGFRSSIRSGAIDFRLYYTAGYMVRTGQSRLLYDYPTEQRLQNALIAPAPIALPFFAPPIAALLFVPFTFLPYLPSLLLFATVNLALLALTIHLMRPHLRALTARWTPLPALLFLTFAPVALTLVMGQLSIFLLLITCLTFTLLESGSPLLAGLIFSIVLVKFQIALPVALLFLLWKQWRLTAGVLSGSAFLAAISACIFGLRGLVPYLRSIAHMSALAGTQLQSSVGVAPRRMANLYGLLFTLAPSNRLATTLTIIASLVLIAWAATRRASLPLAVVVAMLVSYHLYPCDLTLLLLPISLLCNRLFAEDDTLPQPTPHSSKLSWLQNHRRQILLCALGTFLIGPALAELISNDLIFLLALPILALALCPLDWSTITLPQTSPANHPRNLEPAAAHPSSRSFPGELK